MNILKSKINSSIIIFIAIAVFYAIGNCIWWKLNTVILPLPNISSCHFLNVLENLMFFYNAPLIAWIMKFMFYIFGKNLYDLQIIFVNYIFFLISLYYIYKVGVILKDKITGNIAMILFSIVPAIYGMSRQYGHQDYHVMPMVLLNIYLLIKTNYFKDFKWCVLYGISIGLGLLVKDSFLGYFFIPCIFFIIKSIRLNINKNIIKNIFVAVLIGIAIAGCHYFRPLIINKMFFLPVAEPVPFFAFENIRIVTIDISEKLLSPPIFLLFIISFFWFLLKYKNEYKFLIVLWIMIPWSILLFFQHKLVEYMVALIPAIILVSSLFLSYLCRFKLKVLLSIILLIGLFQYVAFSYDLKLNFFEDMVVYYKKNMIKYYDTSVLLKYDKKKAERIFYITKYLKEKYSGLVFYYNSTLNTDLVGPDEIAINLLLNDLKCLNARFFDLDRALYADILINIGKLQTREEIYDDLMFKLEYFNQFKLYFEDKEKLKETINKIFDNYYVIDTFYIDDIKEEKYKVTLLSRK